VSTSPHFPQTYCSSVRKSAQRDRNKTKAIVLSSSKGHHLPISFKLTAVLWGSQHREIRICESKSNCLIIFIVSTSPHFPKTYCNSVRNRFISCYHLQRFNISSFPLKLPQFWGSRCIEIRIKQKQLCYHLHSINISPFPSNLLQLCEEQADMLSSS
jgi:hypothetical protein